MNLFWHPTGPSLRYERGVLYISDLNPEIHTKWRMSRSEMFWLGIKSLLSAIRPATAAVS
jgi:hypothetical protein